MAPAGDPTSNLTSRSIPARHSLSTLGIEFIRMMRGAGRSDRTCGTYQWWLDQFIAQVADDVDALDTTAVTRFLAGLRERGLSPSTVHQAYRTLKTFLGWLVRADVLRHNPMAEVRVKLPATLPDIPTIDEVKAALWCCPDTFEGCRNYAMMLFMLDSGVRSEELRRLRIEHLNPRTGSVLVRGKGAKDRVVFVSASASEAIRNYTAMKLGARESDYLFTDRFGRPLKARHLVQILHRLSRRAGLPPNRRLHPHACRHWAATSWIRAGMGLDQVRRLLGHSTLSTTLRYLSLVPEDLQRAHRDAAVIERLGLLPNSNGAARGRATDGRASAVSRISHPFIKLRPQGR